jgi:hypothetical protein
VTLFFIVPLQIEKAGVQNGLSTLRKKLLVKGVLSLLMSVFTVILLSSRFLLSGDIVRYLNTLLIFLFSLFWFIRELIESSIYHTQFTADQIELHNKIHNEEVKQDKRQEVSRVKRNTTRRNDTKERQKLDSHKLRV